MRLMPTSTVALRMDNVTSSPPLVSIGHGSGSGTPASFDVVAYLSARWLPRDQEYYWSEPWQAAERETLMTLAEGGGRDFESAQEAILWLLRLRQETTASVRGSRSRGMSV
jgi:hypothetical protein